MDLKNRTMELTLEHIGAYGDQPAKIVELTIKGWDSTITEDVTNLQGVVDPELIRTLRFVADELEDQNTKIENKGR